MYDIITSSRKNTLWDNQQPNNIIALVDNIAMLLKIEFLHVRVLATWLVTRYISKLAQISKPIKTSP